FRYHQIMELDQCLPQAHTCAIIGFESEEGVGRNKGRLGAAMAPNAIRTELAKLPFNMSENNKLIDIGKLDCTNHNLEHAQKQLGQAVSHVLHNKITPIILGGGHETAYGHYLGVRDYIGKQATLGSINIDAHFDL